MDIRNKTTITAIVCLICLALAICSFKFVTPIMTDEKRFEWIGESLDEKKTNVIELSSIILGLSVIIAAVPGDSTTPIAEQVTQLNSYLVIALAAISFEKFLFPFLGIVVCKGLIPITLILFALYMIFKKKKLLEASINILVLAAFIMFTIPLGVHISNTIDETFGTSQLIKELEAELNIIDSEYNISTGGTVSNDTSSESESTYDSDNPLSIFQNIVDKFSDTVTDAEDAIKDSISKNNEKLLKKAEATISKVMDIISIIIVSNIAIPILMIFIMIWILKIVIANILHVTPEISIKDLLPPSKCDR